ncbi:hypothetical protein ABZ725_14260 [Streptomyces sp. NPDC006872]|uniref:hypothetical protein n=1 Tax=Streptomyces sp. NPDC006872 TaxID=3155720 RepID=UPI0033D0A8A2
MHSDDILDQIDRALHDYDVSDDAMRSRPAPEPVVFGGVAPTLSIMDEAGEWQETAGVTAVDLHIEPAPIDLEFQQAWQQVQEHFGHLHAERAQRAQEALERFRRSFENAAAPSARQSVQEAARSLAKLAEAVHQPAHCDHHRPALRRDRPAWQSPYGPPQRRQ